LSACPASFCPDRQLEKLKETLLKGMKRGVENYKCKLQSIDDLEQTVKEARRILPDLASLPRPEHYTVITVEEEADFLEGAGEHLFRLPSINKHRLLTAHLVFYSRPVFPRTRISIDVSGRELGSEESYIIGTVDLRSPRSTEKQRMRIEKRIVER
ncbi:hypothetical protein PMAYCL1PPCAC_09001, partial [Pristionchus mayeri]